MTQTEWIVSLDDDLKGYEELFVGNVRDGDRLTRCKNCGHWKYEDSGTDGTAQGECDLMCIFSDGVFFCAGAERREE